MIRVRCKCGKVLETRAELAGRTGTCPVCGNKLVIIAEDAGREGSGGEEKAVRLSGYPPLPSEYYRPKPRPLRVGRVIFFLAILVIVAVVVMLILSGRIPLTGLHLGKPPDYIQPIKENEGSAPKRAPQKTEPEKRDVPPGEQPPAPAQQPGSSPTEPAGGHPA
jgi:hypothetical protein